MRGNFSDNASNLFGLDQGAVVGFEYRFGIARHLQAIAYRTAIDKTFQFYGKYDALRQSGSMPVGVSALVSIEGGNNFQDRYSPALGASVSRTVGDRLALYLTPIWVHNTAAYSRRGSRHLLRRRRRPPEGKRHGVRGCRVVAPACRL